MAPASQWEYTPRRGATCPSGRAAAGRERGGDSASVGSSIAFGAAEGAAAAGGRAIAPQAAQAETVPDAVPSRRPLTDLVLRRRHSRERLITSLNEVAEAISSTKSIEQVLQTVVDEAKRLVDANKIVLCLLSDDGDELRVDEGCLFVRGRRDQYPETWWSAEVREASAAAMARRAPVTLRADHARLLTVPVMIKGHGIGVLTAINGSSRRFSSDQVALMAVLGAFAGTATENARLHDRSENSLLAEERGRIAKEMHDGLSQSLFSVTLELDVCRKRVRDHPADVVTRLDHAQAVLVRSLTELRRYIYDLRPINLDKLGLVGAIGLRAREIAEAGGLSLRVYADGQERSLRPGVEACLYRVAQEAVSNIVKHARATRAVLVVTYRPGSAGLCITDDGCGFDVAKALRGVDREESIGLRSMRERARAEGGTLGVHSDAEGTVVKVEIPC